jgi:hypothetical protein
VKGTHTIKGFLQEVQRVEDAKQDVVVGTKSLTMVDDNTFAINGQSDPIGWTRHASGQIADRLQIPRKFFNDRLPKYPGLRGEIVNRMWHDNDEPRMLRLLDGGLRAYVSDRFQPFDNALVVQPLMPILQGDTEILAPNRLSLSDTRMYLQFNLPSMRAEIVPGDEVTAGIVIRNSEVGNGAFAVEQYVWRVVCHNGLVASKAMNQTHVGRSHELYYEMDTRDADYAAFKLKLRDAIHHAISRDAFDAEVDTLRAAAGVAIRRPETTIKNVTKRFQLTDTQGEEILSDMVSGGNMNLWGVINGVTALAHDTDDADQQYEYERIGYQLATLSRSDLDQLVA